VWIKRHLPFVLIGLWFVVFDLLTTDGKRWAPHVFGSVWFQRPGLIFSALLLTVVVLLSVKRLAAKTGGRAAVVACVVAGLLLVLQTGSLLYASAAMTDIEFDSDLGSIRRMEKLGQGALEGPNPKARRYGARLAYLYTGLTVPYVPETGNAKIFEPSAAEIAERDQRRAQDREEAQTLSLLRLEAQQIRWGANAYLAVAALVLFPGLCWIGARRHRRAGSFAVGSAEGGPSPPSGSDTM
jgi:hypothetical protein